MNNSRGTAPVPALADRSLLSPPAVQQTALRARAEALRRLAKNEAGFPRLRPPQCAEIIAEIADEVKTSLPAVRGGDVVASDELLDVIEMFAASDIRFYPQEILALRIIEAQIHFARNDLAKVRECVGFWLDRPYAAEVGVKGLSDLFMLEGQLRLVGGEEPGETGARAQRQVRLLVRSCLWKATGLFSKFVPLLALSSPIGPKLTVTEKFVHRFAALTLQARRPWSKAKRLLLAWKAAIGVVFGAVGLASFVAFDASKKLFVGESITGQDILVTRAMGGVGDLIMMSAGLRALSKRYGRPIKFAIARMFFPIFFNNPHVELVDIDGPQFDATAFKAWRNLTICPAAAYESVVAPNIRRGRVRLFAGKMGVKRGELKKYGSHVDIFLSEDDCAFAEGFLAAQHFGRRTIIGVQPYSRDSYKDHPGIGDFIRKLAREFDVLVFHHTDEGLPRGPGIATTASLPLSRSFALSARVAAMVTVDSAFLHAAAAFDVPVVALFGPTDGRVVVEHYSKKIVVDAGASFPCAPCWRNEDLPCKLTMQTGVSPCMAAIRYESVRSALDQALAMRK